jgi:hypothetical protein
MVRRRRPCASRPAACGLSYSCSDIAVRVNRCIVSGQLCLNLGCILTAVYHEWSGASVCSGQHQAVLQASAATATRAHAACTQLLHLAAPFQRRAMLHALTRAVALQAAHSSEAWATPRSHLSPHPLVRPWAAALALLCCAATLLQHLIHPAACGPAPGCSLASRNLSENARRHAG